MVEITSVNWVKNGWEWRLTIREGVYHLTDYRVRISHLGFSDAPLIQAALAQVVTALVRQHMRQGSVPPHAMVLDWARAGRICERGPSDLRAACQSIEASHLHEIGGGVSSHF